MQEKLAFACTAATCSCDVLFLFAFVSLPQLLQLEAFYKQQHPRKTDQPKNSTNTDTGVFVCTMINPENARLNANVY